MPRTRAFYRAACVYNRAAVDDNALESASLHRVRITPKTCWTFLRLYTADGRTGDGEATLTGREDALLTSAERLIPGLLKEPPDAEFAHRHRPNSLPEAAIVGAIDQALWSLQAQAAGMSLAQLLGARRTRVPVYANINRRTERRTPAGFAASARAALASGHKAFKVAPFDEVSAEVCAQGDGVAAMRTGLARIAAVREAIGPAARLMVDCHWRFDEATATVLNDALANLSVHWVECPLPEVEAGVPALRRLRRQCNALGMRQAGLETSIGWNGFRPYCEGGAYDVVMPDLKYAGGIREVERIAAMCAGLGIEVSPHNPSGPICHAASLHVSATFDAFDRLELQFDESPLFDMLVGTPFAPIVDGRAKLPQGTGLGVVLDDAILKRHADRPARTWPN